VQIALVQKQVARAYMEKVLMLPQMTGYFSFHNQFASDMPIAM
jgi:hypothetical protein